MELGFTETSNLGTQFFAKAQMLTSVLASSGARRGRRAPHVEGVGHPKWSDRSSGLGCQVDGKRLLRSYRGGETADRRSEESAAWGSTSMRPWPTFRSG